jgi:hypothetical protein
MSGLVALSSSSFVDVYLVTVNTWDNSNNVPQ